MRQLTQKEALEMYNRHDYDNWSDKEKVRFQLFQKYGCIEMDFTTLLNGMTELLGRSVESIELCCKGGMERLQKEYLTELA